MGGAAGGAKGGKSGGFGKKVELGKNCPRVRFIGETYPAEVPLGKFRYFFI